MATAFGATIEKRGCIIEACCCDVSTIDCSDWLFCCASNSDCLCIFQKSCCASNITAFPIGIGHIEDSICSISLPCCALGLKYPQTICRDDAHILCCKHFSELPCTGKVPITVAMYGIMCCYPKCGCCVDLADIVKPTAVKSAIQE